LCLNGQDLSPLPVKLFDKVFEDSEYLPQLQNEMLTCFSDFLTGPDF
jgi:hypothetical protein